MARLDLSSTMVTESGEPLKFLHIVAASISDSPWGAARPGPTSWTGGTNDGLQPTRRVCVIVWVFFSMLVWWGDT